MTNQHELTIEEIETLRHLFPDGMMASEGVRTIGGYVCAFTGADESHWYRPGEPIVVLKYDGESVSVEGSSDILSSGELLPEINGSHIATTAALLDAIADEYGYYETAGESMRKIGALLERVKIGTGKFAWVLSMPDGDLEFPEGEMQAAGVTPKDALEAAVTILALLVSEDDEDEMMAALPPLPQQWKKDGTIYQVYIGGGKSRIWININVTNSGNGKVIWKGAWCPDEVRWAKDIKPPKDVMEALIEQKLGAYFNVDQDEGAPNLEPAA